MGLYLKHKLILYFDENFPIEVFDFFKQVKSLRKKSKVISAYTTKNQNKDDKFHLNYCIKKKYILVTLDIDFWNDRLFPLLKIPGIIILSASKNNFETVIDPLLNLLDFLYKFIFPRDFIGESKFKVSSNGCIMKGLHAKNRRKKIYTFKAVGTPYKLLREYGCI